MTRERGKCDTISGVESRLLALVSGRDGMVDGAFISRWTERLRQEFADAVAVILKGSYARNEAHRFSDVDFDLLTAGGQREECPVFFDRSADGRLIHVSVAVQDLDGWLAGASESPPWAFGLPAAEAMRLLWAADLDLQDRLDQPFRLHPPAEPDLEDFVADLGKVLQARRFGDTLTLRLVAQSLARLCPSVLLQLNHVPRAGTHPEALRLALDMPNTPPGYRVDMLVCLGLSADAPSDGEIARAATRLVVGALDLIEPHVERLSIVLQPGLGDALSDGTLRRYVDQMVEAGG